MSSRNPPFSPLRSGSCRPHREATQQSPMVNTYQPSTAGPLSVCPYRRSAPWAIGRTCAPPPYTTSSSPRLGCCHRWCGMRGARVHGCAGAGAASALTSMMPCVNAPAGAGAAGGAVCGGGCIWPGHGARGGVQRPHRLAVGSGAGLAPRCQQVQRGQKRRSGEGWWWRPGTWGLGGRARPRGMPCVCSARCG